MKAASKLLPLIKINSERSLDSENGAGISVYGRNVSTSNVKNGWRMGRNAKQNCGNIPGQR